MGLVPAPYELAFRVVAGAVLAIAPSLLFVGFWRGLQRMRDDQLVERVLDGADERGFAYGGGRTRLDPSVFAASDADGDGPKRAKKRLAPCPSCGTLKPAGAACTVCDG